MSGRSRSLWERIPVQRFNRACFVFGLMWLAVTVPWGLFSYPTWPDFSQFYMGGMVARTGDWDALYPIPLPNVLDNPGLSIHSFGKPGWHLLRFKYVVPDDTRFILPPPSALVFIPFSFLSLVQAYWVWNFLLLGCVWGVSLIAGRIYRRIVERPTRMEGLLSLLIVLSPMTARSIRIGNVSPPIALLLGLALLALLDRDSNLQASRPWRGAAAMLLGSLLKYATLVLSPLLVAMRQWRVIFWLAGFGALVLAVTVRLAGTEVFDEFFSIIVPTLSRPSAYPGNQSLPGLLARLFGRPMPESVSFALTCARAGTLALILAALFRVRQSEWRNPVNVIAGASILVSWLLIFSPIAWEHWPVFLCPMWGWMLWEARVPGARRILIAASIGMMYIPQGIFQVSGFFMRAANWPEPFNSAQLFGVALCLSLAFTRLARAEAFWSREKRSLSLCSPTSAA